MTVKEFLKKTYKVVDLGYNHILQERRPRVICADGFEVSIQAGRLLYCTPRMNLETGEYSKVELGFPSERDVLIERYREDDIYPYTPIEVVEKLVQKHGGIVEVQ